MKNKFFVFFFAMLALSFVACGSGSSTSDECTEDPGSPACQESEAPSIEE
ncbi:MAG: hypothetical protein HUK20_00585 [Fibrobacter sp.]|nr:hypothetical protein [Fibrobacter sp.]